MMWLFLGIVLMIPVEIHLPIEEINHPDLDGKPWRTIMRALGYDSANAEPPNARALWYRYRVLNQPLRPSVPGLQKTMKDFGLWPQANTQ